MRRRRGSPAAQVAIREQLPAVAAVLVFTVNHLFDWRVTTSPDSYEAFKEWARDPYFNPPDPMFTPGPAENTAPGPLPPPGYPGVEKKEGQVAVPEEDSPDRTPADSDNGQAPADGDDSLAPADGEEDEPKARKNKKKRRKESGSDSSGKSSSAEDVGWSPSGAKRMSVGRSARSCRLAVGLGVGALALTPAQAAGPGRIETVAGAGQAGFSGDGGSARRAHLDEPRDMDIDRTGTLYIADTFNHRIRRVDAGGAISTVAGTGVAGFSGDGGPATAARLTGPKGIVAGPAGELFIADTGNDRIRMVDAPGTITTVAGTGEMGYAGDGGPALAARFDNPRGLALDSAGALYVADDNNDRVRRVDPSGTVTTVAGSEPGYDGDGGPATEAWLKRPRAVALDGVGNLYIADSQNHRVRMVTPSGLITTLAGIGRGGFGGDGGPAEDAKLHSPRGIVTDAAGHVYVADTYNDRIRRIQVG